MLRMLRWCWLSILVVGCGASPSAETDDVARVSSAESPSCVPYYQQHFNVCLYPPLISNLSATSNSATIHFLPYAAPLPAYVYATRNGAQVGARASPNGGAFTESGLQPNVTYTYQLCAVYPEYGVTPCSNINVRTSNGQPDGVQIEIYGKCLDLPASATGNKTHVEIYDCNGGRNQRWDIRSDGTIRPILDGNQCLDIPASNTTDGRGVEIYACNGGANQRWSLGSGGTIRGLNNTCLDLPWGNTTNKTQLAIHQCLWNDHERFSFVR